MDLDANEGVGRGCECEFECESRSRQVLYQVLMYHPVEPVQQQQEKQQQQQCLVELVNGVPGQCTASQRRLCVVSLSLEMPHLPACLPAAASGWLRARLQVESRINVSLPSAPSHPPPYLSTSICLACPFFMTTAG